MVYDLSERELVHVTLSEIDQISESPERPSKAFVQSVRDKGVITPIILRSSGDRYSLVDGRRRILAVDIIEKEWSEVAEKYGDVFIPTVIPAHVIEDSMDDDAVVTLITNTQRSSNPIVELKAMEKLLLDGKNCSDIASLTGLSKTQVEARLRLSYLHSDLREAVEKGKMTAPIANQAAKLPAYMQERLAERLKDKDRINASDVKDVRQVMTEDAVQGLDLEDTLDETPNVVPETLDDSVMLDSPEDQLFYYADKIREILTLRPLLNDPAEIANRIQGGLNVIRAAYLRKKKG